MKINKKEKLFNEFEGISKKQWLSQAIKDLNDPSQILWEPHEGLQIAPFYTRHDPRFNIFPSGSSDSGPGWKYFESIEITNEMEANALALTALNNGADGIIFKVINKELPNFTVLFKDILPQYCHIIFETKEYNLKTLKYYFKYCFDTGNIPAEEISGAIKWDPLSDWTLEKNKSFPSFSILEEMLKTPENAPGFRYFCISSVIFNNSGATPIKEIAFMISSLIEYLRVFYKSGIAPEVVFRKLWLVVSIGKNYFFEIAKIRALKMLVNQIAKTYNVQNFNENDIYLHATTSWWTKTAKDSYTNILRNTTEAMAGILGGCTSLSILPHDIVTKNNNEFSSRLSRNISNLLKEETYLDKVSNPADGSYYIENLTHQMLQKIWENVQNIEKEGGFIEAFRKGYLQEMVAPDYKNAVASFIKGNDKVIGTNSYVNEEDMSLILLEKTQLKGWFTTNRLTEILERQSDRS